ncbi:MAG: MaoC family dehydratase [Dehalococcoidales bacterium]|nr:MaoC family dehydratase [Dehalococcoidales bacterium]
MLEKPRLSDIHQGDSLPSVIKHITQQDINRYAEASGDFNPIHVDETFAAKTPLGGTIAHGMLVLAYLSEMMTQAFGSCWLEEGKLAVRFKSAARPQDTITTSGQIDSIEDKDGIPQVNCSLECCNQKGEIIINGRATVKLH